MILFIKYDNIFRIHIHPQVEKYIKTVKSVKVKSKNNNFFLQLKISYVHYEVIQLVKLILLQKMNSESHQRHKSTITEG